MFNYSKLIYHLLSLLAISPTATRQVETKFFGSIKKSLGLSKTVSREKLTQCLNINPPTNIATKHMNRCKGKLQSLLPSSKDKTTEETLAQIIDKAKNPQKKTPPTRDKNSIWNNDNFLLLYLGNFDWLGKAGHRCQCSSAPISSKAILQCTELIDKNPLWKSHAQETNKYLKMNFGEQETNLTETWTSALNAFVTYARNQRPLNETLRKKIKIKTKSTMKGKKNPEGPHKGPPHLHA